MRRAAPPAIPNLDPNSLARFVDPLPLPLIAKPVGLGPVPGEAGPHVPHYRVAMRATRTKLHRDLPPTNLWSYGGRVPGVTFDTQSGQGLAVEWVNELPAKHFLPIDHTLHGAEPGTPEGRGVVNAANGRFYRLSMTPQVQMHQIGSDPFICTWSSSRSSIAAVSTAFST